MKFGIAYRTITGEIRIRWSCGGTGDKRCKCLEGDTMRENKGHQWSETGELTRRYKNNRNFR